MSSECVVPPSRLNSVRCVRGDVISPSDTAACEGQGVPQHQAACLRVLRTGCQNTRTNGGKDASRQIPFHGFVEGWCWRPCVQSRGPGTDRGRGMSQPWQLQRCGLGYPWRWLPPWKPDTVAVQEFSAHISQLEQPGWVWLALTRCHSKEFMATPSTG